MRIKRNTLFIVLVLLAISWGIGYQYLNYQFNNLIDEQFNKISSNTHKLFILNMQQKKKNLEFKLTKIISINGLAKAVADKDNKKINSIIQTFHEDFKLIGNDVDILTFNSSDSVVLYRAHDPESFGDKRKLIIDKNTFYQTSNGFEISDSNIMYRVTKPIFYKSKYVGNVELEVPPNRFIKDLNSIFKIEIGIAIDKFMLNESSQKLQRELTPIDDKYLLIEGSDDLKAHILQNNNKSSELYKIDNTILLKNYVDDISGYFILGYDISSIVQKNREFMYRLFFMMVIMSFIIGIVIHISFKAIFDQLKKQIYTDHLTCLPNREALENILFQDKTNLLILSNIKEFSLLNEIYGIKTGNQVLIEVAKGFESFSDEHDFNVYRISSDEFVLVKFGDDFDPEEYLDIIKELHKHISKLVIKVEGVNDTINVEIYSGVTVGHEHSLAEAQMALKKVKEKSLSYLAYSKQVDRKKYSQEVINIKKILRYALKNNNVIPFFQPITDKSGEIIKYEALVRIIEQNKNEEIILTPNEFLKISMQSGLYTNVAISMLKQSLDFFAHKDKKISVNFLPSDFFNTLIMDTLKDCIEKYEAPSRIVVEIIEQDSIEDFDRLMKVIKHLKKTGIQIAIDDFGSGYANYAHILKIRPDYLKIDGSLITNILKNEESRILVKSIINFAHELNIIIVAEYVESEEIFELLKEYGVDEYQGYYFGKPTNLLNK